MTYRFSGAFFLLLFVFSLQLFAIPQPTEAGLVPCGRTPNPANQNGDPDLSTPINESAPCTVCHLVVGSQGLIAWGLKVMTFIAVAVIVAMAILYIVSAGNEGLMSTAKSGITASLIGFAVMLGAWLIVSTVINTLADTQDPSKVLSTLQSQGTFRFTCDTASNVGASSGVRVNPGIVPAGATTTTPSSATNMPTGAGTKYGNGKCEPVPAGPCSVENLRKTCFGDKAEIASIFCNVESFGNQVLPSGIDKCQPGKQVASWGLFQINLSANSIGGLACPATTGAFDRMLDYNNKTCVIREPLYGACVEKAKDAAANIQKACELSRNGTNWQPWSYTRNKCGL